MVFAAKTSAFAENSLPNEPCGKCPKRRQVKAYLLEVVFRRTESSEVHRGRRELGQSDAGAALVVPRNHPLQGKGRFQCAAAVGQVVRRGDGDRLCSISWTGCPRGGRLVAVVEQVAEELLSFSLSVVVSVLDVPVADRGGL